MLKLWGVHTDHRQNVCELLFNRTQFSKNVVAVHAAQGPEVEQHDPAAQALKV
jgi:hypothetical protein